MAVEEVIVDFVKTNLSEIIHIMNTTIHNESDFSYVNDTLETNQFILPLWRQLLWTALFAGMVIVGTGGNLIVIWIVLANKRMRTVTNYFLLNLSLADTMSSSLNVTFNYFYMLNGHWPFGHYYCKINQFIAVLSICASVFSLIAISIDRYMAIMTPLRPRMGKITTLGVAISTWTIGTLISVPCLFVYTTELQKYTKSSDRIICFAQWPDGLTYDSPYEYWFNIIIIIVTYMVPIGSMIYSYARIGIELWGSQSIGECTQRQMDNIKNKRRVVKMMMVVVVIFGVCWLPFHLYFILVNYFPEITNSAYVQETYLAIYWLAMSNSMYNPIIYFWMNARFRRGFKQFFSWKTFSRSGSSALTRKEVFTSRRRSNSGSPDHNRITRNGTIRILGYNNGTCTSAVSENHTSYTSMMHDHQRSHYVELKKLQQQQQQSFNATTTGGGETIAKSREKLLPASVGGQRKETSPGDDVNAGGGVRQKRTWI